MGTLPKTIDTRRLLDLPDDYAPVPRAIAARLHPLAQHPVVEHDVVSWGRCDDRDVTLCEITGIPVSGAAPVRFLHLLPTELFDALPPVTDVLGIMAVATAESEEARLADRVEQWLAEEEEPPQPPLPW